MNGCFCTLLYVTLILYLVFGILEIVLDFYLQITYATF